LDCLLTLRCRFVRWICEVDFLERCLKHGIYTQRLRKSIRCSKLEASAGVCNDFLRAELTNAKEVLAKLKDEIMVLLPLESSLAFYSFCKYTKMTKTIIQRTRTRAEIKYQRLLYTCSPIFPMDINDRIVNLSNYDLSETEKQALCFGLDFAVPPQRAKQVEIDAEFENLFQQLNVFTPISNDDLASLRADLVKISKTYGRSQLGQSCLLPCHIRALKQLKQNPDILLLRPDKGSGVIVMNTSSYLQKFDEILSDTSKFKIDVKQEDASNKVTTALSKLLKKLRSVGVISNEQYRRLMPQGAVPPRMYGLPKVHKDGVPIRPIVSMTRSAYEPLSKWLACALKPVEDVFTNRCVKDSFQFVDELRSLNVSNNVMASFDVTSLFTNVPVAETIDIIIDEVEKTPDLCSIPLNVLRELLLVCTSNVQFLFNGIFYRQIDGVAMGSHLGPMFANIFMGHLERKLADEIDKSCKCYFRFMDDTFCVVRNRSEVERLLNNFNSAHPNLSFTSEIECCDSLPFLDVRVHRRRDGSTAFSIFRKKTWTGVYTNFHSFVPLAYKRGVVRSLFLRALRLCSSEYIDEECDFIKNSLVRNAYPTHFINENKVISIEPKPLTATAEKKAIFLRVPFYGEKAATFVKKVCEPSNLWEISGIPSPCCF
jgi:hypothetical protein